MGAPMRCIPWSNLRAVVFDFDGTLAHTCIDFGLMRERTIEVIKQWGVWEEGLDQGRYVLELVQVGAERLAADPARAAGFRLAAMEAIEGVEMASCADAGLFAGVSPAVAQLRESGLAIGVITRNCRRAVEPILRRSGLAYDALLTRDDVARVKPDPGHLLGCLELLGVQPGEALLVGDHPTDMQCGRAAGSYTCGVLTDTTEAPALQDAGADLVMPDVAAVVDAVRSRALVPGDRHG